MAHDWSDDPLYTAFAPRRARRVAVVAAGVFLLLMVVLAVGIPTGGLLDRLGFVLLGFFVAWLLYRLTWVRATPSPEGLVVRNVFITTRLEWPQVLGVTFGDRPWPVLDLSDTDTVAVMAIQRADGEFGRREAVRLADLVQRHGIEETTS
ncbi:MAG: PH domain-containing protein [Actinomycetales bacterium]